MPHLHGYSLEQITYQYAIYIVTNLFSDIKSYDFEAMAITLRGLGVGMNELLISFGLIVLMELFNLYERGGDVWIQLKNKPIWIR